MYIGIQADAGYRSIHKNNMLLEMYRQVEIPEYTNDPLKKKQKKRNF